MAGKRVWSVVVKRILEVEAKPAKRANAARTEAEVVDAVDAALGWARRRR